MFCYLIFSLCVKSTLARDDISIISKKDCFEASLLQTFDTMGKEFADFQSYLIEKSSSPQVKHMHVLSQIEELAKFHRLNPIPNYEVIKTEGPAHQPTFTIQLKLGDETYEGMGNSKKIAKRNAASSALEKTNYPFPIRESTGNALTPTVKLNNFAAKFGHAIAYYLVDKTKFGTKYYLLNSKNNFSLSLDNAGLGQESPPKGPFTVRVLVDDVEFLGFGHTIQAARHDAAAKALHKSPNKDICDDNCRVNKSNLKSSISKVYELVESREVELFFTLIKEEGPPHKRVFTTQCQFGEIFSEGIGKSKKESKKIAAENMLKYLEKLGNLPQNSANFKRTTKSTKNKAKSSDFSYSDTISSFFSLSNEEKSDFSPRKPSKKRVSPKNKLLELSSLMEISVNFQKLKLKNQSYSLLILGTDPVNVCLGQGINWDEAEGNAALKGLRFLNTLAFSPAEETSEIRDETPIKPVVYLENKS